MSWILSVRLSSANMSKNTGIPYEILTQSIFQAIQDQSEIKNIKVQHNVELPGRILRHQIDVYWEYEIGGILYRTVVQTKDWEQAVSQGPLLQFKGVLDDLPGQPRGIFVTRTGYQSGARPRRRVDPDTTTTKNRH